MLLSDLLLRDWSRSGDHLLDLLAELLIPEERGQGRQGADVSDVTDVLQDGGGKGRPLRGRGWLPARRLPRCGLWLRARAADTLR